MFYVCIIENLLKDIPGVIVYLYEILISGKSEGEYLATLEALQRFTRASLHLKSEVYFSSTSPGTYLGYRIDS